MSKKGYQPSYKPQERAYYTRARTEILKNEIELRCNVCGTDRRIEIHHETRTLLTTA